METLQNKFRDQRILEFFFETPSLKISKIESKNLPRCQIAFHVSFHLLHKSIIYVHILGFQNVKTELVEHFTGQT